MRRFIVVGIGVLCAAILPLGFPERAWAQDQDNFCVNPQGTVGEFLTSRSQQELKQQALAEASAARPSSDGLSGGGRLDLLRRAFVGLGLGQVTDEEGQLVFNFNPDVLHLDSMGQFSPRIVVHQAEIDGALNEYIDALGEDVPTSAREDLKKDLGDLDDVEYSIRWTPAPFEPAQDLKDVAGSLMNEVVPVTPSGLVEKVAQENREIGKSLGLSEEQLLLVGGTVTLKEVCGNTDATAALKRAVEALSTDIPLLNAALGEALNNNGFTRLADLIEGSPRLVVSGNYRQRSGAAGADTTTIDVTWQRGWVSYRGAKKAAGGGDLTKASLDSYFEKHGRLEGAAPLFSLVASYAETDSFLVPIAGVADPFRQDSVQKLSIKGTAATYFGGGRDRKLELTLGYDDVSNDEALQNRFVANLTWVETLSDTLAQAVGGSEFVASLIWANRPEYRGEVDEDFGLRAGLKWSLGNGVTN